MKGQDTIARVERVHDILEQERSACFRAILELEGFAKLPDGSVLQSVYEYLCLHNAYICEALQDIDAITNSYIYG